MRTSLAAVAVLVAATACTGNDGDPSAAPTSPSGTTMSASATPSTRIPARCDDAAGPVAPTSFVVPLDEPALVAEAGPLPCSVWIGGSDRTGGAARLALVLPSGEVRKVDLAPDLMRVEAVATVGTTTWLATTVTGGGGQVLRSEGADAPFRVMASVPAPATMLSLCAGGSRAAAIVNEGDQEQSTSLLLLPERRTVRRGDRKLTRCAYDGDTGVAAGVRGNRLVMDTWVSGGDVRTVPVGRVDATLVRSLTSAGGHRVFVGGDFDRASAGTEGLMSVLVGVADGRVTRVVLDAPELTGSVRLANGHLLVTVAGGDDTFRTLELDGTKVVASHDVPGHDTLLAADPRRNVAWWAGEDVRLLGP